MGWLEGLLTGYADRHFQIEQEKRAEAEKAAERQGKVFEALLNSDDDELKAYAGAGILDLANPRKRKGGIAGWMGEIEQTPYLDIIRRYQERVGPEQGGMPPATPSVPTPAGQVPASPSGSLAQPSTSAVEGGPVTPPTPAPTASFRPQSQPPPQFGAPPGASFAPQGAAQQAQPFGPPPSGTSFMPPPQPPAGPPLPVASGPPPPPEAGMSGASTRAVGGDAAGPPRRTQLLRPIFPTKAELLQQEYRARSAGADLGEQDSYIRVAQANGAKDPVAEGMRMWAENQAKARGTGSALQNAPMEFDVRHPDGTTTRELGWADRRTQQYVGMNGLPFPAGDKVTRAAPYSALVGDVYWKEAVANLGLQPWQVTNNPALAQQVQAEANKIAQDRAGGLVTARGLAAADNPLNAQGRINQIDKWQTKYNAYQAPLRLMELYLRNAASSYAELKKGNMTAWEPFRTAFVHVNEAGSVVMPSEFSRSGTIGSLVDRVQGQIDQWLKGGGTLPPGLVDDMMNVAAAQWEAVQGYDQNFRSQVDEALKDPALQGIRPEQVFGAPRTRFDPWTIAKPAEPAPPPPPPGGGGGAAGTVPGATGTVYNPTTGLYEPKK